MEELSSAVTFDKIKVENRSIHLNRRKEIQEHDSIILPITVIGELRFGAYRSTKQSDNLVKIDALEMRCEIIEIESSIADFYGSIKATLAQKEPRYLRMIRD
jgi:predicted nucleic acid-binding protein